MQSLNDFRATYGRMAMRSLLIVVMTLIDGCVDQSDTIVTFDQTLESTSFTNQLLSPIVLYRDGVLLDTLPARTSRDYPIGRKGAVRHAWKLIAPLSPNRRKMGVEPFIDLGVQYVIRGNYSITNESLSGRTLFTPRVLNTSFWNLQLTVNYQVEDPFYTDYIIPSNSIVPTYIDSRAHAPYFYWNSNSNVVLDAVGSVITYYATRLDTNEARRLKLDDAYPGSGLTAPIEVR